MKCVCGLVSDNDVDYFPQSLVTSTLWNDKYLRRQ